MAKQAPTGESWVFEVKSDGYRLLVRKHADTVRIFTRRGADWTKRFPRVAAAVRRIKADSLLTDGEAIVYDGAGVSSFDLLHSRARDREASMLAFDLLELNGTAVRRQPLVEHKEPLGDLLKKAPDGIEYSDHLEGDGNTIFEYVCKLGHEGIVAKRKDLAYGSGRSRRWLKIRNPNSPAMKRYDEGTS